MLELFVRIAIATAMLIIPGTTGLISFEPTWRIAAFFATYSFLAYVMERRGMRNSGVSGLFGVADSGVVALILAEAGLLQSLGFAVLLPAAWTAFRFGSDPIAMAPMVSGWMLIGANLFNGPGWTPMIMSQAALTLGIGLLSGRKPKTVKVREIVEVRAENSDDNSNYHEYFELREKFRVLRDHASELERKGRSDRIFVLLNEVLEDSTQANLGTMSNKLCEILRIDGLIIHSLNNNLGKLIVQTAAGELPSQIRDAAYDIPSYMGEWQLRDKLSAAMIANRLPEDSEHSTTIILKFRGRIVGTLSLYDKIKHRIAEAAEIANEIAEHLAKIVRAQDRSEESKKRLKQAELLYQLAGVGQGADSATTLCNRIIRELFDALRVDHLSICSVTEGDASLLAQQGPNLNAIADLSLPSGNGIEGWLAALAPEIVVLDGRNDGRLDRTQVLKKRIGSLAICPVLINDTIYGYITASTNRVFGIDATTLESLRLISHELSQSLGRILNGHQDNSGLTMPGEFHKRINDTQMGFLVYLDVLRKDEIIESFGRPAFDMSLKKLSSHLRAQLPHNGMVCRRIEGDFVAYLPTEDEGFARKWATSAAASASLVTVSSIDQQNKTSFTVKTKVAKLAQQSNQISQESPFVSTK